MRPQAIYALLCLVALCCQACRAPESEDDGPDASEAFERKVLQEDWQTADTGPWGTLLYRRFFLPLPEQWRNVAPNSQTPSWHVPKITPEKVNDLIATGPLTPEEKKLWLGTCKMEMESDGVIIHPSQEFRWALKPESRALFYGWLSRFPQNESLAYPLCYPASAQEEWFAHCDLRPELIGAIKHLTYPRGTSICFSDYDLLDEFLNSPEERAELVTVLSRLPYCEVRIKLNKKTDISALAAYWGEWHRSERVKSKLKSSLADKQEAYMPIASILPPLPRSLLNTYPAMRVDSATPPSNCTWTSLNFFNRTSDDRFVHPAEFEKAITQYHDVVQGTPRYGDILVLKNENGRTVHVAVYLAADFVYTKNGGHETKPWVIMKLSELKAAYPSLSPLKESYHRWTPQKSKSS
ncbi:MAG TPA: hypothetical protein VGH19_00715 [Verrucomicrobiae bacterium]